MASVKLLKLICTYAGLIIYIATLTCLLIVLYSYCITKLGLSSYLNVGINLSLLILVFTCFTNQRYITSLKTNSSAADLTLSSKVDQSSI